MPSLGRSHDSIASWRRVLSRTSGTLKNDPVIRALLLIAAGAIVAPLQVLEPLLFGRAISALSQRQNPLGFVALRCLLSLSAFTTWS